jgi:hypothetical protein
MTRYRRLAAPWLIFVLALYSQRGYAVKLKETSRKQSIAVRFIGRTAPMPRSTFGANHDSYIALLQGAKNKDNWPFVKLVYRFLDYDHSLPALFMDYEFVHRFRAVRQPDCDEPTDTMLYSKHLSSFGQVLDTEFSFAFAKNASEIVIPSESILPCYIVTPSDYKGSDRIISRHSDTATAAGKSSLTLAHKAP